MKLKLSDGDDGTRETLYAMAAIIHDAAAGSALLARLVAQVTRNHARKSQQLAAAFAFVNRSMRFEEDPDGVEYVRGVDAMIREIEAKGRTLGDCDDRAVLLASMLIRLGFEVALVVSARDAGRDFEHVYTAVRQNGGWWPLDPQEYMVPGREAPYVRREVFPLSGLDRGRTVA